jgi:hypothetical protein
MYSSIVHAVLNQLAHTSQMFIYAKSCHWPSYPSGISPPFKGRGLILPITGIKYRMIETERKRAMVAEKKFCFTPSLKAKMKKKGGGQMLPIFTR